MPFIFEPEALGVYEPADQTWVRSKATPVPIRVIQDPIPYEVSVAPSMRPVYIRCTDSPGTQAVLQPFAHQAQQQGWPYHELTTGHLAMITAPEALATVLLSLDP